MPDQPLLRACAARARSRPRTAAPSASVATAFAAPGRHIAVVGAGIAGIACARTLVQAGHRVLLIDEGDEVGGRMASQATPFGTFDSGAQYFTVRDARFERALATVPGLCRPWSANTVRVLDPLGRLAAAALPAREPHWVAVPAMNALARRWAEPLAAAGALRSHTRVLRIERDPLQRGQWQLRTESMPGAAGAYPVLSGFDAVVLAVPAPVAAALIEASGLAPRWAAAVGQVQVAPCWTLMLAFPQAMQAGMHALGPQWNAARSTHHRIAWLTRESSKPQRGPVERWTVQASAAWSQEHRGDDAERIRGKLCRAFSEVTGIRTQPAHAKVRLWPHAQTLAPLAGAAVHAWDPSQGLGACGDWGRGHRVEDAFVSGLEAALAIA